MTDIQDRILEDFCRELTDSGRFTTDQIQKVRTALRGATKPKGADIAKILAEDETGAVP